MVAWGIKAIWNFTPARIKVPEDIIVQNTTLYSNLAIIFNKLHNEKKDVDE
jgi:redox-sensing transcriptional repressor